MLMKLTTDDYWKELLKNSDFSISRRLTENAERMSEENVIGGKWHKKNNVPKFFSPNFGTFSNTSSDLVSNVIQTFI